MLVLATRLSKHEELRFEMNLSRKMLGHLNEMMVNSGVGENQYIRAAQHVAQLSQEREQSQS